MICRHLVSGGVDEICLRLALEPLLLQSSLWPRITKYIGSSSTSNLLSVLGPTSRFSFFKKENIAAVRTQAARNISCVLEKTLVF